MVAEPGATPVTTPPTSTVAISKSELDQVPPAVVFVNIVVAPTQTIGVPKIVATVGKGFTVITIVVVVAHCPAVGVNV
jgi:hypothetical protein